MGAGRAWAASMISALSNALEVDAGDAGVAVSELALDDDERHAFMSHLDRVGVAEVVWHEASPHAGRGSRSAQVCAGGRIRP
jgi:hypothetical protein